MVQSALIRQSIQEAQATARGAVARMADEQRRHRTRSLSEDLADMATSGAYFLLTDRQGQFKLSNGPVPPTIPAGGWTAIGPQGWYRYHGVPYVYARAAFSVGRMHYDLFVVRQEKRVAIIVAMLAKILALGELLLVVSLLLGVTVVVRELTHPLNRLRAFAERVAERPDRAERIPVTSGLYEVDALTRAFDHMLERITEAQDRERQFASDAAHALRTPVQVIRGYLRTLSHWGRNEPEVREQALAALTREAAGMQILIQRLLMLTRLESRDEPISGIPIDLQEFLYTIQPDLADTCPHHELTITAGPGLWIHADPELLQTVCRILVENADAYAEEGTVVEVSAAYARGGVEVAVANYGPEIPAEILPHLFERFYRGPMPSSSHHFGLGLAIANRIVEQIGGRWRIQSQQGRTVFGVWFPALALFSESREESVQKLAKE